MNNETLELKLIVGTKVRIGKKYAEEIGSFDEGEVIELIKGYFEFENGLYTETQTAPAIFEDNEFHSIYHLFGNDLENFMDCEICTV